MKNLKKVVYPHRGMALTSHFQLPPLFNANNELSTNYGPRIFISKEKYIHFINETDNFFNKNSCENKARNIKYIRIIGNEINKYVIPNKYKNKYGIWLIGYDGQDKSY